MVREHDKQAAGVIQRTASFAVERAHQVRLLIVCNTKSIHGSGIETHHTIRTEFYSDSELSEVLRPLREHHFEVLGVLNEHDFYDQYGGNYAVSDDSPIVVINFGSARTGPWGKTLVPAIADAAGMISTNSNAYAIALARHKAHSAFIIQALGLCDNQCWFYDRDHGWLAEREPLAGTEVIVMPAYESASIGITSDSKRIVDESLTPFVQAVADEFRQGVVVRPFVSGLEIECPIVTESKAYALPPVCISLDGSGNMGNGFLTYDDVYADGYSFSPLCDIVSPETVNMVRETAINISQAHGLRGFSRVDFRLSRDGVLTATDVSASPHFVAHSSFASSAASLQISPDHLILSLVGLALMRHESSI